MADFKIGDRVAVGENTWGCPMGEYTVHSLHDGWRDREGYAVLLDGRLPGYWLCPLDDMTATGRQAIVPEFTVVAYDPKVGPPKSESAKRKDRPLARGVLDYFPDALMAVAELSRIANEQHNPGQPMHWAFGKSMDHEDCLLRHLIDRGTLDTDGVSHSVKVAWRGLALLQTELEKADPELHARREASRQKAAKGETP